MRVIQKKIRVKTIDEVKIVFIGDLHVGNINCDKPLLERTVKKIADLGDYFIGMGDYADAIVSHPHETRYDLDVIDKNFLTPREQYDYVYNLFKPIADKGIVLLTGNHDEILRQRHYHDWVDELAYKLGIPYGSMCTFLRLKLIQGGEKGTIVNVDMLLHHGYFSGRTKTNAIKRALDMKQLFEADIYAMGHVHMKDFTSDVVLTVDRKLRIMEKRRYYLTTGGFLRGYVDGNVSGYIEKKMLLPTTLGAMRLIIKYEKEKIDEGYTPKIRCWAEEI